MSNLTARAKALVQGSRSLASVAAIGLVASTQVNAIPIVDSAYVGHWNVSGMFTEAFTDPNGAGWGYGAVRYDRYGEGLKLWGDATMSGRGVTGQGEGIQGLAFSWTGSFAHDLSAGDSILFDYDFNLTSNGEDVAWQVTSYISRWEPDTGLWSQTLGTNAYAYDSERSGVVGEGSHDLQGSSQSNVVQEDGEYFWTVTLAAHWLNYAGDNSVGASDIFNVLIPNNSIDIGINAVPTEGPIVSVSEPGTLSLLGLGLAGLGLVRRRK